MSKIKHTIYFLSLFLIVFLISIFILTNMNKIIPSYIGEVLFYSNIYSNKNQNEQSMSKRIEVINKYLESAGYYTFTTIANSDNILEEYMENEMLSNIINYILNDVLSTEKVKEDDLYKRSDIKIIPETIFGDIIFFTYNTRILSDDNQMAIYRFNIAFSKDYKNIYYSIYDETLVGNLNEYQNEYYSVYDGTQIIDDSSEYQNMYYPGYDEIQIDEEVEKSVDGIKERCAKILRDLKITDYFTYEPESIWLSEIENNIYIIKDTKNNIEVHYNFKTMCITGLIIGFDFAQ